MTAQEVGATRHQRIYVARPDGIDPPALEELLKLLAAPAGLPAGEVIVLLQALLPDFRRSSGGRSGPAPRWRQR